jgi:hypothetical protein
LLPGCGVLGSGSGGSRSNGGCCCSCFLDSSLLSSGLLRSSLSLSLLLSRFDSLFDGECLLLGTFLLSEPRLFFLFSPLAGSLDGCVNVFLWCRRRRWGSSR